MLAMLDLHFNSVIPCSTPGLQEMADAPSALTFWQEVARRYGPNPLVGFDLYNEPHDISDAVWRNGGAATHAGVPFIAAGMQQLYDAVRSQGASNLVFVSGNHWGSTVPDAAPLAGFNVVYAVHAYTCPVSLPPECDSPTPLDPSSLLGPWVSLSSHVPVVITEFGWPDPNDGRYITNVVKFAEAHGWGWTAFAWDGTTSGKFDLLADVGPGASYRPTPAGIAVLSGLLGVG
jgi:aryl-phospho-beta-D-glucosidase BglC (GH1 family)